jgi:uncharacterized membrane protein YhhN
MIETQPPVAVTARPAVRVAGLVYVLLAVGHLTAVLADAPNVARPTQWLLMPALAALLLAATAGRPRSRLVTLVLVALGFSWLGDTVPSALSGEPAYLSQVGLFLVAHLFSITAFWPYRRDSVLRRPAVLGYVAALAALLILCGPHTGGMFGPLVVYGVCLILMAVLGTGVDRLAGIGGAVFVVSDSLIGFDRFVDWFDPPVPAFWIMVTYLVAQPLIVAGVLRRDQRR